MGCVYNEIHLQYVISMGASAAALLAVWPYLPASHRHIAEKRGIPGVKMLTELHKPWRTRWIWI